ncbi:hypothetical protein ACUHMQ_06080 [Chitinimonas sp. PSY-7]|uniref:hypothetical protein n=1 Tax=Chitinimonas sp. PSY-7 TaxID=3459088 RepID=UPI0040402FD7
MRSISAYIGICILCQWAQAGTMDDADLGRLFFSPEERTKLNRARVGIFDSQSLGDMSKTIHLDGILQRPGKPPILWVNGSRLKSDTVAGATVQAASNTNTLLVNLPEQPDAQGQLNVGQTLDPANGSVREAYQRPTQSSRLLLKRLSERGAKTPLPTTAKQSTTRQPTRSN